jgi:hypothetical protein
MNFYGAKMDVARFATALQLRFGKDSQLTTITRLGKSEVYSVSTVIDTLSDATVKAMASTYSLQLTVISLENTQVTKFPRK